jgi:GxxExxY protein
MDRVRIEPDEYLNAVARQVVDAAYQVHTTLGAGLLESVYERCLHYELTSRGMDCQVQVELPVIYRGVSIDQGLRIDLLVEGCLIVEVKAVEELLPVHRAQILTYLKLTGNNLGLLINFNTPIIKDGIKRVVHTVKIT